MARLGVTYHNVANAADQLIGQGKTPTIELVRQILQTGSTTTIANHLRKWRAEQEETSGILKRSTIPDEMVSLMQGLWERLNYQANEIIKASEGQHQQMIERLQQECEKYKANNHRWQQLFNQWQQEKEKLLANQLMLEEGVKALEKEKAGLNAKLEAQVEQLVEKEARISELHQLHQQMQKNLEHYRESTREQRLIEKQQFDEQLQSLKADNKTLNEELQFKNDKLNHLQHQYTALADAHVSLEKEFTNIEKKLEEAKDRQLDLNTRLSEHRQSSLHWQKQYENVHQLLDEKTNKVSDYQADIKVLVQQRDAAEKIIHDLEKQNKCLVQEKWDIASEKSQLEGQLKQMQGLVLMPEGA